MPDLLQAVWALSIVLAFLSCGVMAGLVIARLVRQQRDRDLPARSVQLTLDLLGYGKGEAGPPHLRTGSRHDCDLIMKTALDVSRAFEGGKRSSVSSASCAERRSTPTTGALQFAAMCLTELPRSNSCGCSAIRRPCAL